MLTPCLFPCSTLLLQRSTSRGWCGTPGEALSSPPTPLCTPGSSRAQPTSTAASSTPTTWPRDWVSAQGPPQSLCFTGSSWLLLLGQPQLYLIDLTGLHLQQAQAGMLKVNSFFFFFLYSIELGLEPLLGLKNDQVLRWYKTGGFYSNPTKALFAWIKLYLH